MNKTITAETRLNNIKSLCAERDRKEHERLRLSRLDMERREEAEKERVQSTNSILNSYIEKVKARENQQLQERSQSIQNMHDEYERRRLEDAYKTKRMSSVIHKAMSNVYENDRKSADDFMNRHKRLLDKGRETVKREQNKTYFS